MIGTLVAKGLTCKYWLGFQKVHKILEKDIEIKYKKTNKKNKKQQQQQLKKQLSNKRLEHITFFPENAT